jgi:predicted transporter
VNHTGPVLTIGIILVVLIIGLVIGLVVGFVAGLLTGRRRRAAGRPPEPPEPPQSFGPPAT